MNDKDYTDKIFKECCGRKVDKLWRMYCAELEGKKIESEGDKVDSEGDKDDGK